MKSSRSAGPGPTANDSLSDISDESVVISETYGIHTTQTINIYEAKLGNHLAAAWMILRFLRDNNGAQEVRRVGDALLGQEAFTNSILELDLDEV